MYVKRFKYKLESLIHQTTDDPWLGIIFRKKFTYFGSLSPSRVPKIASNNHFEVPSPPDDAIQAIRFNPAVAGMPILLAAGSWDCTIRIWQVNESGTVEPKAMQNVGAPILSIDWTDVNSGFVK